MKKQIILKIYGKVQGVFFREETRKKAKELNLAGSVKNEPDGTVRIVAEGEESELEEFTEWCRSSPDHTKVDKVEVEWFGSANHFHDFLIE